MVKDNRPTEQIETMYHGLTDKQREELESYIGITPRTNVFDTYLMNGLLIIEIKKSIKKLEAKVNRLARNKGKK